MPRFARPCPSSPRMDFDQFLPSSFLWPSIAVFRGEHAILVIVLHSSRFTAHPSFSSLQARTRLLASPCTLQGGGQQTRSCRCSERAAARPLLGGLVMRVTSTDPPCPACRVPCKWTLSSSPSVSRASGRTRHAHSW
uniref:Uncharacterized protein n=1 Tax=Setaria viridis TaxID=4556 RepID=A0A4U6UZ56_SETVI|nr:hypothetical protein SEVIR_4G174500v2 [Setaria viridis]